MKSKNYLGKLGHSARGARIRSWRVYIYEGYNAFWGPSVYSGLNALAENIVSQLRNYGIRNSSDLFYV